MKRKLLKLLAAVFILCFIGACSSEEVNTEQTTAATYTGPNAHKYGGMLMLRLNAIPRTWLLYDQPRYFSNSTILNLIAAPLIRVPVEGEPEPVIAEWFEVSADNTRLTVAIKTNAKWHDGEPVTADDYVFSREYMANEYWGDPDSLEAYTVNKIDDLTFEIVLPEADKHILENYGSLHALPKHIYENIKPVAAYTTDVVFPPVSNGPFKIVEAMSGEYVVLKAFDDFACGRPYLDEIYLRHAARTTEAGVAFAIGELDVLIGSKSDLPGIIPETVVYTTLPGKKQTVGYHDHLHIEECGLTKNDVAIFERPELLWTERR